MSSSDTSPSLPRLEAGQKLNIEALRHSGERPWRHAVVVGGCASTLLLLYLASVTVPELLAIVLVLVTLQLGGAWVLWRLFVAMTLGNAIRVSPSQFPQIHSLVERSSQLLEIPVPKVFIVQGHGELSLSVAKRFTRRGVIILTSNLVDKLVRDSSRHLMMVIGRELGHIAAGHYRGWYFTDTVGTLLFPIYLAWRRRCELTADRIGLMVSGDIRSAEQGLLKLAVGENLAAGTSPEAITEQREDLHDDGWATVARFFSETPYMVERLVALREFASAVEVPNRDEQLAVAALPIMHQRIKVLPIMLLHGHNRLVLLETKDFLRAAFPHVIPLVLGTEVAGSETVPRKLELVAEEVRGAIALLTPDDVAWSKAGGEGLTRNRARQNVVLEIGWFWGVLGRQRCMLLVQGEMELPSDLAGVEYFTFNQSPLERTEQIRKFIAFLEGTRSVAFEEFPAAQYDSARNAQGTAIAKGNCSVDAHGEVRHRLALPDRVDPLDPAAEAAENFPRDRAD